MVALAIYVAGNDELQCSVEDRRTSCVLEHHRFLGLVSRGSRHFSGVIDALVQTSTTDHTTITPSGNKFITTSANNSLLLKLKSGKEVVTLGGEKSFEYGSEIEALIKTGHGQIVLSNSNWRMAGVLGGLGAVFALFGAIAIRLSG